MPVFCSSCGAQVPDEAVFCQACGRTVNPVPAGASAVPPSPQGGERASAAPRAGLADNVAGALAYLFVPAVIFLVIEPYNKDRFIRFHSFQALAYWVVWVVASVVLGAIPLLGMLVMPLVGLAFFIGWVVLGIKAFQGAMFKMPVIGDFAEKQANR
ncbi:MAG TPA: zinc-ribbon domain-containing protein [Clostridia bacterium]|nr:zinc-ribbon domain-containing protein [Clostridia bacterium]